jgi:opacity protein-like surface antigen
MKSRLASISILALIALLVPATQALARGNTKPLRLEWGKVEGCERYQVQIMDTPGNIVLDRTVDTNYIQFILPLGSYRFRVAAINKFDKISFWSDWNSFEIRQKVEREFFTNDYTEGVGLKISGGWSYVMLLSPWNTQYHNTYKNYIATIGFHFGNSRFIKHAGLFRFTGIELEGGYGIYSGKYNALTRLSLKQYTGGLNFLVKTNLDIPLNFHLTAGGGMCLTEQARKRFYLSQSVIQNSTIRSQDAYFKAGASVEFNFMYSLSLNLGAEYFMVFYQDRIMKSVRYFALMGVRI